MNRADNGRSVGYTILETMIFLAVSAALFITAMAFINGRQSRTEFSAAVRDFEASMNDTANDVSDGYYNNSISTGTATGKRITCSVTGTTFTFSTSDSDTNQGANKGCIFIGEALQFMPIGPDGNEIYVSIPLVGRQYKNGDASYGDVETYADSSVRPLARLGGTGIDATSSQRIGGGVTADCVFYATSTVAPAGDKPCTNTAGITRVDTVSFMTRFHATLGGKQETGSASVNLVVPKAAQATSRSTSDAANALLAYTDATPSNIVLNPAGGVYICLQSNGTDQHALVSLGGSNGRFTSNTQVVAGKCL